MRAVCDRIASGELVEAAARAEGTTGKSIRLWAIEDSELGAMYARARQLHADALFDGILTLARSAQGLPSEGVAAVRVEVDTTKWVASRIAPRLYGDKLELSIPEPVAFILKREA